MSAAAVLPPVPVEQIRARTEPWALQAHQLQVSDDSMFALGAEYLRDIKSLLDEIASKCDPVVKAAHQAHKAAVAQKKELSAELVQADALIRSKLATYVAEKERKQQALAAAEEAAARAAQEKAAREAAELEAAGERDLAELALAEAVAPLPPPMVAPAIAAPGVSSRKNWKARVTNMRAFVQAALDGKIPMTALQVNETMLNQQARSLEDQLKWPGVEVYNDTRMVVR